MLTKTLRLSKTDSVDSNNRNFGFGVDIGVHTKTLPFNDLSRIVDAYEVYTQERESCDRFRLTLTIKPYCSNVLYNTCTEIVKEYIDEQGNYKIIVADDRNPTDTNPRNELTIFGKQSVTRSEMIDNTEYSREEIGFDYRPGVDIFDNHMFRSGSFRVVCKKNGNTDLFNTIKDNMRYADGRVVNFFPRDGRQTPFDGQMYSKNMYDYSNTLTFQESVFANISEDDGWIGFTNISGVNAKDDEGNLMNINKVINNREGCEFVDLYPDRTLFSFTPKYNPVLGREEKNWDMILTYPCDNFYNHPLVRNVKSYNQVTGKYEFGNVNALLVKDVKVFYSGSGDRRVMFRTYSKHGLQKNDVFNLYYSLSDVFNVIENYEGTEPDFDKTNPVYTPGESDFEHTKTCSFPITVTALGDYNNNNGEYCFIADAFNGLREMLRYYFEFYETSAVGNDDSSNELPDPDSLSNEDINTILSQNIFTIRLNRLVSDIESEYYFRVMRRFPNMKLARTELDSETALDKNKFDEYIHQNTYTDGKPLEYDRETYKLAFSNTAYNDGVTQTVVTDDAVLTHIVDNQSRPVTELYYTIIKRNKGHEYWYSENDYNFIDDGINREIEYSHCFGKVTSGVDILSTEEDAEPAVIWKKGKLSDCHTINNNNTNYPFTDHATMSMENYFNEDVSATVERGIEVENELFIGDLVCFNGMEANEIVIGDMCYRFNTAQREVPGNFEKFIPTKHTVLGNDFGEASVKKETGKRKDMLLSEGYYYKAHYPVRVGEFGYLNQASHRTILVSRAEPVQSEGIAIKITTQSKHNLYGGNEIYICDDSSVNGFWEKTYVKDVLDDHNFTIQTIPNNSPNYINWIDLSESITDRSIKLRLRNYDIPDYAKRIMTNTFVWRDKISAGDANRSITPEYPFANNSFYIDTVIDFYLKRQDPFNYNGLRANIGDSEFYFGLYGEDYKQNGGVFVREGNITC